MPQDYLTGPPPPQDFNNPKPYLDWKLGEQAAKRKAAADAKAAAESKKRQSALQENIATHGKLLDEQRGKLLSGFRTGTEANVGRSLGAVKRSAALTAARAGGGGAGIAGGRGMALAEAGLRGQGNAQMADFTNKLGLLQSQQKEAFMRGEFGFMHEMEKMVADQQFQQSMMLLQNKLQRDQESRNAFWGLARDVGEFASQWIPIPGAQAAVNALPE